MDAKRDNDIDPAPLQGRRVAIIGYGNQGRPQAMNLRDSGIDVVVGLRSGSSSATRAKSDGIVTVPIPQAASSADAVMLLAPDEMLAAIYREIEPELRQGAALGFSHGLAIRFGFILPRSDLDVFMVAPKGPGTALRSLYEAGKGMVALYAVEQDATGAAEGIALAYGRAIGCARAGLLASTFAEECEADLFNEQAVLWGAIPELIRAGFDILVEAGFSPEIAYFECLTEVKLIADLIHARGIAGMQEAISTTAQMGAFEGQRRIVTEESRAEMRRILAEVRSGRFVRDLVGEAEAGYPQLEAWRTAARAHPIEAIGAELRKLASPQRG